MPAKTAVKPPVKPKGKNGGARPGAGRPRKADANATPIKDAEKRIADRLPILIDNMFVLALNGDRDATKYLIDRVMGKPTERVETKETGTLTIEDKTRKKAEKELREWRERMRAELSSSPSAASIPATSPTNSA